MPDDRPSTKRDAVSQRIEDQFGKIDIYLWDQLLRGRLDESRQVLDAGSGNGRNLVFLLKAGFEVFAADSSSEAISATRELAHSLRPDLPASNFRQAAIESLPYSNDQFDFIVSSAVLHFSRDESHFRSMVQEMWRTLRSGGILFARLSSTIGIESRVLRLEGRRYRLPSGTEWFLVDEEMLLELTRSLNGQLLDPIKTTNVQNLRCMTTWVVRKS